jgi:hypothetical protein
MVVAWSLHVILFNKHCLVDWVLQKVHVTGSMVKHHTLVPLL